MKMPYCSACTIGEDAGPSHAITNRQRVARAVAGITWLALAWAFLGGPVNLVLFAARADGRGRLGGSDTQRQRGGVKSRSEEGE
jgi:hypothetical protein